MRPETLWPESLPPAVPEGAWDGSRNPGRRETVKALHSIEPARLAVLVVFLVPWIAAVVLGHYRPVWPLRIVEWLVAGIAIHGLAILMHEGSHGNVFRRPTLDRWFAFACGAPALLSGAAYRVTHLDHHRFLRSKQDPEEFTSFTSRTWAHSILFWLWIFIGGATYIFLVPLNGLLRGRRRERLEILLEYLLLAGLYLGLFIVVRRSGLGSDALHGLVIPWGVAITFTNVRGWAEHAMTAGGSPLLLSRVVTSNGFVSLVMLNSNYHLVHHLYPAVPWYNLKKLYRILEDELRRANASIYASYFRFLLDAVRVGVHGVAGGDSARPH